jgi:hypothetical protein
VKGQLNHFGVNDIEVTSPGEKGKDKLVVGRVYITCIIVGNSIEGIKVDHYNSTTPQSYCK